MRVSCERHDAWDRTCGDCVGVARAEGLWLPDAVEYRAGKVLDEALYEAASSVLSMAEGANLAADPEYDGAVILTRPDGTRVRCVLDDDDGGGELDDGYADARGAARGLRSRLPGVP